MKLAAGVPLPDKPYPAITFNPVSVEGHSDTVEGHPDSHESSLSRTESLYNEFNFKEKQFFASMAKKTSPFKAFPSAVPVDESPTPIIEFPQDNNNHNSSSDSVLVINTQPEGYAILERTGSPDNNISVIPETQQFRRPYTLYLHLNSMTHLSLQHKS